MPGLGGLGRLKAAAGARWARLRGRHAWLDHTARGYGHYQRRHGDYLAAAVTYFSFLALFPLVLLGVSVVGFVLASNDHLQKELFAKITAQMPGGLGDTLSAAISTAINERATVGLIGLVGVLLTGLGWIGNLRTGIDTLWDNEPRKQGFLQRKLSDALVLAGLGIGLLVSVGVTAGGTAASHQVLVGLNLDGVTGAGTATAAIALLLAVLGNLLIYGWLIIRLPDAQVSRRTAFRASLLAAVGFELLKIVGTFYIARITHSPAGSVVGTALGVLVFLNLVARYSLFCVAWAATAPDTERAPDRVTELLAAPVAGPSVEIRGRAPSPLGVAAGLVSAGATLGAATFAVLQGRRSRARSRRPPRR
ncbi:MAG TPA: YhjD/YihY/BrkB family envelope integrity protein [Jatrophihabitans sp.]|nr:YhjD/YihY/BrkB family envelope integrity protein [Jatrophihabitans sp.]